MLFDDYGHTVSQCHPCSGSSSNELLIMTMNWEVSENSNAVRQKITNEEEERDRVSEGNSSVGPCVKTSSHDRRGRARKE